MYTNNKNKHTNPCQYQNIRFAENAHYMYIFGITKGKGNAITSGNKKKKEY